jgi:hypothetical protein
VEWGEKGLHDKEENITLEAGNNGFVGCSSCLMYAPYIFLMDDGRLHDF